MRSNQQHSSGAHVRLALMAGILSVLGGLGTPVSATNLFVSPAGTNHSPFTNWADAATNLQNALNIAASNDVIYVTNATYVATTYHNITKPISIYGFGGKPIFDGNGSTFLFYVNHDGALLNGFIISNGLSSTPGGLRIDKGTVQDSIITHCISTDATYGGGGVFIVNGVLSNCIVSNNMALLSHGGGIYRYSTGATNLDIINCRVVNNVATNAPKTGGGMYFFGPGTVTGCLFRANTAVSGGGVCLGVSEIYPQGFMNNVFDANIATNIYDVTGNGSGGGMYASGGSTNRIIRNCLFQNNVSHTKLTGPSSSGGAGIYVYGGGLLDQCQFYSNYVHGSEGYGGAAILFQAGLVTFPNHARNCLLAYNTCNLPDNEGALFQRSGISIIENCTIVSNRANAMVGGIFFRGGTGMVVNTIAYFNDVGSGTYSNYRIYSLAFAAFTNSLIAPTNGMSVYTNVFNTNPKFMSKDGGDFRLTRESPCVNAGINLDWMPGTPDLDGRPRLDRFSGQVDIGAYEFVFPGTFVIIP